MTRQLIKGMTMLLLVVALSFVTAVVSANAQSSTLARADIPFEFVIGNKTLSAGRYDVSAANDAGDVIKVSARETSETAIRLTMNRRTNAPSDKGKLVFRRYGNRYFLAEVWHAGERDGLELMKSKEEKAIQRELASIQSKTDFAQSSYKRIEIAFVKR